MGLRDLTPKPMEAALGGAERLGRDAFLERYGFGHERQYFIKCNGHEYDSKAIAGAAHGYAKRRAISCVISTGRECLGAAMSIIRRPMQGRALVFWARS